MMKEKHNFDDLFESAMRQEPGYQLPDYFIKGVNERLARKLAFRVHLKMMGGYVIILASILGLMLAGNYIIAHYLPKYSDYTVSLNVAGGLAFLVLFILFMDRVVLSYLASRYQH